MAMKYANIENIGKLISGGAVTELTKRSGSPKSRRRISLKSCTELENAKIAKKLEEERLAAEKIAAEEAARKAAEEAAKAAEEQAKQAAKPVREPEVKVEKPLPAKPAEKAPFKPAAENKTFVNRDNRPQRGPVRGNAPFNIITITPHVLKDPSAQSSTARLRPRPLRLRRLSRKISDPTRRKALKRPTSKKTDARSLNAPFKNSRAQASKISTRTKAVTESCA